MKGQKKRICYVVTMPLSIRAFFIPQLHFLAKNGYDVSVICDTDGSLQEELGKDIRVIPLHIPRGIAFKESLTAIKELIRIFKREKFDLVQYSTPNAAFYAAVASLAAGIKRRNYHLMGLRYLGEDGLNKKALKCIEKIACVCSTSIECVSQSNLQLGISEGLFTAKKATVIGSGSTGGVDLQKFSFSKREQWRKETREQNGYTQEDFVFGYVGRITGDKGINELLEAFLAIRDNSKLFLIGFYEGFDMDEALLQRAKQSGRVLIHEAVADIERYYAMMDVLVLPSYREGFGNVVIEAGAVGTPAIVTRIPGPVDAVIEGKTAFSVPVRDAGALRIAMEKAEKSDCIQMGLDAKQFVVDNFDSERLNQLILQRKNELTRT